MHVCDENCSWRQTPDSLRALGYELRDLPDNPFTPQIIARNMEFDRVKHQAWLDGKIRLCTRTERCAT